MPEGPEIEAGGTVNEALMLRTGASRLQAEASDQWAYYQAKGIKAGIQEADRSPWLAAGKEPPAEFVAKEKRYADEQAEVEKAAREKERERDERVAESDHLLHRHHRFATAVAALTRQKAIWVGSLVLGVVRDRAFQVPSGVRFLNGSIDMNASRNC
jgi:hypothetical protein